MEDVVFNNLIRFKSRVRGVGGGGGRSGDKSFVSAYLSQHFLA